MVQALLMVNLAVACNRLIFYFAYIGQWIFWQAGNPRKMKKIL